MAWQSPKTNWKSADAVAPGDMNRIEGNIQFLHDEYIISGPESARPAPGHAGRLYIAAGLAQRIWRDTGSAWELAAGVPKGVIQMWSGSVASIPQGWVLCDGRTTTAADGRQVTVPDLRDRFIVGAGGAYAVGDKGGAAQVTLTVEQMPAHSHSASCSTNGAHNHGGVTGTAGAHQHVETIGELNIYGLSPGWHGQYFGTSSGGNRDLTSTAGNHNHTISTDGAHTHAISIGSTGGGQPHENRPPYYALCFIYKL